MKRFNFITAIMLIGLLLIAGICPAGSLSSSTSSITLRSTSAPTSSKVLSTTSSLLTHASASDAIDFFYTVNTWNADSVTVVPAFTYYDNSGNGTYWEVSEYSKTYTTTGTYNISVPRNKLGYDIIGVKAWGAGTLTGSPSLKAEYKSEQ